MSELNNPEAIQKQGNGRKVLLLLVLIFVLPFTMAVILHALDIRPSGKSFGNLITPPVSLDIPELTDAQGKTFRATNWQKKWNIVMMVRDGCDDRCLAKIDLVSKVHISLNKDIKRVQRILLFLTETNSETIADLQKKYPDLIVLVGNDETIKQFASNLETVGETQNIYLIDPLGYLMMYYPQDFDPKGLRGDLVRLLKNSWAG
jgi:cytochrome oxidase Cu insertion factor (SCO1/SenC/PrrC family)